MAENKKSFVAYCDWENQLDLLSDEEAGKLFRHLLAYVNDKNPEFSKEERILKMAFEPIKLQLKRDLEKYEEVKKKRSEAGRSGGIKSGIKRSKTEQNQPNEANASPSEPNEANASFVKQTEANEAVNVNVNVNDNVILLEKETKEENIIKENSEEILQDDKTLEKEERKKVAQKKEIKLFNFKNELIAYGFDPGLSEEFMRIRKSKKAINSKIAFDNFISQIQKTGREPNEVLKIITEKQWKGFQAEWLNNLENGKSNSNITINRGIAARQNGSKVDGTSEIISGNFRYIEPS